MQRRLQMQSQWQADMEIYQGMDYTPPMITDPPPTDSNNLCLNRGLPETSSTISINKHCKGDLGLMWDAHEGSSPDDALMATMTQIANLLSGFQKQFPPTNNQLRTFHHSRTHATVHDGHIVTEPVQRKAPGNNGNTGTRGKKVICYNCRGEGHVARQYAEAEAFLADMECTAPYDQPKALTTTNMFQANHEDAYDSDVDEGPNAAVAFMANLSIQLIYQYTSDTEAQNVQTEDLLTISDKVSRIAILNWTCKPTSGMSVPTRSNDLEIKVRQMPYVSTVLRRMNNGFFDKINNATQFLLLASVHQRGKPATATPGTPFDHKSRDLQVNCYGQSSNSYNAVFPQFEVWKPISKPVANSKPQWKPTGSFSLFEKYPLTRIMESTDMPIELPRVASIF
ncbi:hypothetical protein Tco_1368625 [Tanacetum coccineum]